MKHLVKEAEEKRQGALTQGRGAALTPVLGALPAKLVAHFAHDFTSDSLPEADLRRRFPAA